jgi:hypothetical protein
VISWRFGLDGPALTVREVSLALAVSCSTAHAMEQSALELLRQAEDLERSALDLDWHHRDRRRQCER